MKAAERRELLQRHNEYCVAMGHALPVPQLEKMARTLFPPGSLPDDSDTPQFSSRELEIIRNLLWETKEMEQRRMHAELERALAHQHGKVSNP